MQLLLFACAALLSIWMTFGSLGPLLSHIMENGIVWWTALLDRTLQGAGCTPMLHDLMICGICTALILLQGLRVLGTILQGAPFSTQNAVSLRRAAVCSFCIAGAALLRTIWGLWFYQSLRPLATYNALFVPIFTMFGLLCLVMSALFRQATEMKVENDLTI